MKIQTNAVNVLERTSAYLRSGLLKNTPAWYDVVASVPPRTRFAREPRLLNPSNMKKLTELREQMGELNGKGLYKTRASSLDRKINTSKLYRAPKLQFFEDQLREVFYQQHPWEFSRPKMLVENDAEEEYDWSRIQQLGKPLDGESVVQRTLYLLKESPGKSVVEAYDQARFEFYRLRMQQEVEQQVAQEECEMFGSVYGTSAIDFGVEQEQKVIDVWKQKALEETDLLAARRANPSETWAAAEDEEGKKGPEDQNTEEIVL
ncbi:hypothetical protein HG536_0A02280 [Torulaspora globosa]|uniref:37S ribosomal protein S25, mitochondrial n=1 Tax=Torulaspora globosa TaxID=48254 RepID=A0A7G3ZA75_9SACH|nr:uncharacterized protein HG536_0A02280 [Torulaspora globosa]QLL30411.1 hypothetical protein HG536_0A02280 [Torulaspora globosa]